MAGMHRDKCGAASVAGVMAALAITKASSAYDGVHPRHPPHSRPGSSSWAAWPWCATALAATDTSQTRSSSHAQACACYNRYRNLFLYSSSPPVQANACAWSTLTLRAAWPWQTFCARPKKKL